MALLTLALRVLPCHRRLSSGLHHDASVSKHINKNKANQSSGNNNWRRVRPLGTETLGVALTGIRACATVFFVLVHPQQPERALDELVCGTTFFFLWLIFFWSGARVRVGRIDRALLGQCAVVAKVCSECEVARVQSDGENTHGLGHCKKTCTLPQILFFGPHV